MVIFGKLIKRLVENLGSGCYVDGGGLCFVVDCFGVWCWIVWVIVKG